MKKLKESLSQNDALLKLGIGGRASGSGGRAGGGGGGQARGAKRGPNKGNRGKGAGGARDNSHLRCFHCRKKVYFSIFRCFIFFNILFFRAT